MYRLKVPIPAVAGMTVFNWSLILITKLLFTTKKSPHFGCVGGCDYLSHIFLSHSDFLLQSPSCVFEQFLHFPFLFSDFDIFSFLCLFYCYLSGQINNTPVAVLRQYVCFPKKIMGEFTPIVLLSVCT